VTDSELLDAARRVCELADIAADQDAATHRTSDGRDYDLPRRGSTTRLYALREQALHLRHLLEERIRQDREIREQ